MRVLKERKFNYGTMTEAMYWSKIRSALRSAFRYWKPAQEALNRASRPNKGKSKARKEYQCNICKVWYKRTEVEIDHIIECGSLKSYNDVVPFLKRLTIEDPEGFQVLCKACHKKKGDDYRNKNKTKV